MMEAPPRRAKRRRTAVPSGSPRPVVSVIVPAHNAAEWLPDCLASIASQTFPHGALEVCLCDDASTDSTRAVVDTWAAKLRGSGILRSHDDNGAGENDAEQTDARGGAATVGSSERSPAPPTPPPQTAETGITSAANAAPSTAANSTAIQPASSPTPPQARGAGFAKNTAVASSSGEWLCFLDADDTMHADRIERQYALAKEHESIRRKAILAAPTTDATAASGTALTTATPPTTGHVLVGAGFVRKPAGSTEHYTRWCNSLTPAQLWLQQFREVTVIQPTWFLSRAAFDRVGGY